MEVKKREFIKTLIDISGWGAEQGTWERGWAAAISDAIAIAEELDEPEKVVVPSFIADYIERAKPRHDSLYQAMEERAGEEVNEWVQAFYNSDKFARAWLDGYEVEKEKLYRVRAGNRYVRFNLDGSIIGVKKDNSIVCLERLSKLPFDYKKAIESGIITLEEVTE